MDGKALDLRSAHQQTLHLKENQLNRSDLDNFVACYLGRDGSPQPSVGDSVNRPYLSRHERKDSERFKTFPYEELIKRDKLNLDIFCLKDESLEDSANLPDPDVIAAEIVEDLQAALAQFAEIAADLKR